MFKHRALKKYGRMEVKFRAFIISELEWRWVVKFTLRTSYPRWKNLRHSLGRRLGYCHSRSGSGGEEKNLYSCQEPNPDRPAFKM